MAEFKLLRVTVQSTFIQEPSVEAIHQEKIEEKSEEIPIKRAEPDLTKKEQEERHQDKPLKKFKTEYPKKDERVKKEEKPKAEEGAPGEEEHQKKGLKHEL